jgi:Protein of unknown function (DUF3489)
MSTKLTETQLVILSAAAQRDDRCLTAPKGLKGASAQKVTSKLIAAGLVKEIKAKPGMAVWRRDEAEGQSFALKLTAAGMKSIAVEDEGDAPVATTVHSEPPMLAEGANSHTERSPAISKAPPREGTKMARVVGLLQRADGATLAELIAATDWLPHTTRAALTGLRKRGYPVTLDRSDKELGSTYFISPDPSVGEGNFGGSTVEPAPAAASRSKSSQCEPAELTAAGVPA